MPSTALVISIIALVLALGGTSYAAFTLPANSVGTAQLKQGAVTTSKIKNGAVTASKIDATGLTVPNAQHASSADNAAHASTADTASAAENGVFAFGQVREDASIRSASSELVSVAHPGSGIYCLVFRDAAPQIALEGAVVSEAGSDPLPTLVPRVTNGQNTDCSFGQLDVRVQSTSGTLTDGRFSFIVP